MNKRTWIKSVLKHQGYITRNQALKNYCSRLAADINVLKPHFEEEGYEIIGEDLETDYGTDYKYSLKRKDQLFA